MPARRLTMSIREELEEFWELWSKETEETISNFMFSAYCSSGSLRRSSLNMRNGY
jgi:hypothetical protein